LNKVGRLANGLGELGDQALGGDVLGGGVDLLAVCAGEVLDGRLDELACVVKVELAI
jgi:hypothetical protein